MQLNKKIEESAKGPVEGWNAGFQTAVGEFYTTGSVLCSDRNDKRGMNLEHP